MSYILEALRKSETERKQGQIPDLGSSVQIIHKRRKSGASLLPWILVLALLVNTGVLAWLFWPTGDGAVAARLPEITGSLPVSAPVPSPETPGETKPDSPVPVNVVDGVPEPTGEPLVATRIDPSTRSSPPSSTPSSTLLNRSVEPTPAPASADRQQEQAVIDVSLSVPSLGDMPASFQRQVPDLTFNSHIFSSNPDARRIMINNEYLREGARFQGMIVEEITGDGVILSLGGESFVVSVVRNWNSPR